MEVLDANGWIGDLKGLSEYWGDVTERVNPVIFVDFPTTDPEAMSNFYATLFGWTFNRRPAGEFHDVLPGVKPNLGIHRVESAMSGPVPRVYVMVDDPPKHVVDDRLQHRRIRAAAAVACLAKANDACIGFDAHEEERHRVAAGTKGGR